MHMFSPRGPVVKMVRQSYTYETKLNGYKSVLEECLAHLRCNPGIVRIELDGEVIWEAE